MQINEIYCLLTKLHGHEALRACHRDSRAFLHSNEATISCRTLRVAGLQQKAQFCVERQQTERSCSQDRYTLKTLVCVPLCNEGDGCLTTDCKMSIKTGKNCSLTAKTMPPNHKSEVRYVACNYRPPAPFALRAHLPCTAAPARTCTTTT